MKLPRLTSKVAIVGEDKTASREFSRFWNTLADPVESLPAVVVGGPAASTNGDFAQWDGATGTLLKDGGYKPSSFDAAGAAAAALVAAEAYADTHDATTLATAEAYTDAGIATRQPLDADLTALAALAATAGMVSRTGAGAFAVRTLAATSPLQMADGTGAAAAPTVSFINQSANTCLCGPTTGAAAAPAFRALVAADIPSLSATYLPLAGGTMAGAIALANGSAAAPELAFNTNYGLFYDATNVGMGIAANGSEVGFFSSIGLTQSLSGSSQVLLQSDTAAAFVSERYTSDVTSALTTLRKARGTRAGAAVPALGDTLGEFAFQGYNGAGFTNGARLRVQLTETGTVSSTAMGSQFQVRVSPIGSGTVADVLWADNEAGLQMFGANKVIDQNRDLITRSRTVASAPSNTQGGLYSFSNMNGGQGIAYGGATSIRDIASGLPITATINGRGVLSKFTGTEATATSAFRGIVNTTMAKLNDAGLLAKLLGLWVHAVPTNSTDALLNWITPGTNNLSIVGSPTWTANQGFTGDGSTALLDTGASVTTLGASQNDFTMGCYVRTAGTGSAKAVMGANTVGQSRQFYFQTFTSGALATAICNTPNAADTLTPTAYTGLFVATRSGASAWKDSWMDAAATSYTRGSNNPGTRSICFLGCADTTASEFSNAQIAFSFVATNLSAAQIASLRAIMVDYYLVQVGAAFANGVYTVANLPLVTTVPEGTRLNVSDANATTFNSTVAAGGANHMGVRNNATNWVIG